jgi:hypothetical protein
VGVPEPAFAASAAGPMMPIRWAVQWRSCNRLDGRREFFLWLNPSTPALFQTRAEARAYIREKYGYIAERPDLRREPHGWRLPRPVKVTVALRECLSRRSQLRRLGKGGRC